MVNVGQNGKEAHNRTSEYSHLDEMMLQKISSYRIKCIRKVLQLGITTCENLNKYFMRKHILSHVKC